MREATVRQQLIVLVETIDMDLVQELIAMWQHDLTELSPATRTSALAKAITEVGRIAKIMYLLNYIDDAS